MDDLTEEELAEQMFSKRLLATVAAILTTVALATVGATCLLHALVGVLSG